MLSITFAMLLVLVIAAAVCVYAARPHRQREVSSTHWLGTVVGRTQDSAPTQVEATRDRAVR